MNVGGYDPRDIDRFRRRIALFTVRKEPMIIHFPAVEYHWSVDEDDKAERGSTVITFWKKT